MGRYDLSDRRWARAAPHLPPEKPPTGWPNDDHRRILNGILWVHGTGAPWRDLPERYGPVGTVSSWFYRWRQAGVWDRVLAALQAEADARGEVDWELHFVDATVVRAHRHAAGARPGPAPSGGEGDEAQAREALGRSQGGLATKVHPRAEGHGRPITVVLTGGERHGQIALEAVLDRGAILGARAVAAPACGRAGWPATRATAARRRAAACAGGASSRSSRSGSTSPAGPRLRPRGLPAAERGRAPDQPVEAVPADRHPLREARPQLPRHAHHRHDSSVDLSFADRP